MTKDPRAPLRMPPSVLVPQHQWREAEDRASKWRTMCEAAIVERDEARKALRSASGAIRSICDSLLAAISGDPVPPVTAKDHPRFLAGYEAGLADGRRVAERDVIGPAIEAARRGADCGDLVRILKGGAS